MKLSHGSGQRDLAIERGHRDAAGRGKSPTGEPVLYLLGNAAIGELCVSAIVATFGKSSIVQLFPPLHRYRQ